MIAKRVKEESVEAVIVITLVEALGTIMMEDITITITLEKVTLEQVPPGEVPLEEVPLEEVEMQAETGAVTEEKLNSHCYASEFKKDSISMPLHFEPMVSQIISRSFDIRFWN